MEIGRKAKDIFHQRVDILRDIFQSLKDDYGLSEPTLDNLESNCLVYKLEDKCPITLQTIEELKKVERKLKSTHDLLISFKISDDIYPTAMYRNISDNFDLRQVSIDDILKIIKKYPTVLTKSPLFIIEFMVYDNRWAEGYSAYGDDEN